MRKLLVCLTALGAIATAGHATPAQARPVDIIVLPQARIIDLPQARVVQYYEPDWRAREEFRRREEWRRREAWRAAHRYPPPGYYAPPQPRPYYLPRY